MIVQKAVSKNFTINSILDLVSVDPNLESTDDSEEISRRIKEYLQNQERLNTVVLEIGRQMAERSDVLRSHAFLYGKLSEFPVSTLAKKEDFCDG